MEFENRVVTWDGFESDIAVPFSGCKLGPVSVTVFASSFTADYTNFRPKLGGSLRQGMGVKLGGSWLSTELSETSA